MRSAPSSLWPLALSVTVALAALACSGGPPAEPASSPASSASPSPQDHEEHLAGSAQTPDVGSHPPNEALPEISALCVALATLPTQSGDLVAYLDEAPITGPGIFVPPSAADLAAFQTAFEQLIEAGPTQEAISSLQSLGFSVLHFRDTPTGGEYVIVQDTAPLAGRGTFVLNVTPARELWLETPHADSDTGTLHQGAEALVTLGARALVITGSNRCASPTPTPCSGNSAECGGTLRISDAAHYDQTYFTAAHKALRRSFGNGLALSLHGFASSGVELAIVSNGTKDPQTSSKSVALRDAINGRITGTTLRAFSCNDPSDSGYRDLCGTANVQGRFDNDAADACSGPKPTSAQERFLHIEQAKVLRQEGNDVTVQALGAIVPCTLAGNGLSCPTVAPVCP